MAEIVVPAAVEYRAWRELRDKSALEKVTVTCRREGERLKRDLIRVFVWSLRGRSTYVYICMVLVRILH